MDLRTQPRDVTLDRGATSRGVSGALRCVGLAVILVGAGLYLVPKVWPALGRQPHPTVRVEPEVPVTAMNRAVGPASNSPVLTQDPTDSNFMLLANRLDAPDFSCALNVSGDGGHSWLPASPVPMLPAEAEKCYAPEVAFDTSGEIYYLFVGLAGAGNQPVGAYLTTSVDHAQTFSPPRRILGPSNFAVRMVIDPSLGRYGRIHIVWLSASSITSGGFGPPPNPILAAYSDDAGTTFSAPTQVSDASRQRVVAPTVSLGPNHAVYVAYYDLEADAVDYQGLEGPTWEGPWSLVVARSLDGGRQFGPGIVAAGELRPPDRVMLIFTMAPPSMVVHDQRVCLGWTDARFGDADVFVSCSSDRSQHWNRARRVNDDPQGNGKSQLLPRLAFAPTGRLDVIFYDRRSDPKNLNNSVYFSYSTNGGRTFARNMQLNRDGASFSLIGQRYGNRSAKGQVEFGSRIALLSSPRSVVAAWTDTRNSRPFTTDQDIFSSRLLLSSTSGAMLSTWVVVLIVAGAGTLLGMVVRQRWWARVDPLS